VDAVRGDRVVAAVLVGLALVGVGRRVADGRSAVLKA
jgi:hypothetical protein